MGDGIQAAKAGILEIADVFVVNKADRDGADATMRELRHMITLGPGPRTGSSDDPWAPPVLKTVAARKEGIGEVVAALDAHHAWLTRTARSWVDDASRAESEIEAIAFGALRARIGDLRGDSRLETLAARVVAGTTDPYAAADTLVAGLAI